MQKSATEQLIILAERLAMTGEIGDGLVAQFHELAGLARLERASRPQVIVHAVEPIRQHAFVVADGGRCRNCGAPR